jgi:beta-lactamase class A
MSSENLSKSIGPAPLIAAIDRIANSSGGQVGLSALHLETGRRIGYHADEPFPLASTVKVAITTALFEQIDSGKLALSTLVAVWPSDFVPSGTLAAKFPHAGLSLSIANLTHLMIIDSDNTATDVILRTIGGMEAVRQTLEGLGIAGINPCRSIAQLYCDLWDIPQLEDPDASVLARMQSDPIRFQQWKDTSSQPDPAYTADPRDQGTPAAMVELLRQLWTAESVSETARDFLVTTMRQTVTGPDRIRFRLPTEVTIAHKTGSCPGTINDAGYLMLPADSGTLALAIYVKASDDPPGAARAIADLARLIYDYTVLKSG